MFMYSTQEITANKIGSKDCTETNVKQTNTFLFISDKSYDTVNYLAHFNNSYKADSYAHAKNQLLSNGTQTEMIVIDMPLNHIELVEFKVWLTTHHFNNIPLVYNEDALKADQVNKLFSQKLVDDVIHLEKTYTKLPYKARFIQKLNNTKLAHSKDAHGIENKSWKFLLIRAIDILVSGVAIICLLPIFLILAIVVKLDSKGPAFYSSLRAGRGFKVFKFYKFRTMIVDADKKIEELKALNLYADSDKAANFFKIQNDPRITKLGAFLRNSSLDELPQLFNVLKGDMSLVGNRPLPLYEATTLTTDEWAERFMAPAGITGLWQISKRGKADMSNEERIFLDIDYARNRTVKGDLKILIQTPGALMQKANV